jgi:glucose/arabinose dehydrogenase
LPLAPLLLSAALTLAVAGGCRRPQSVLAPVNPDVDGGGTPGAATLPESVAGAASPTPVLPTATPVPVPTQVTPPPEAVTLPPGFAIGVFAAGLEGVRFLAYSPDGDLFASIPSQNRVVVLPDANQDGTADAVTTFAEGAAYHLNMPHGLAFRGRWLYVANTDGVVRFETFPTEHIARGPPETLLPLPGEGQHWTRTLAWGPDELLYVSVGSSCDACVEENPLRAAVVRFRPDGSDGTLFARGLRNAVGLAFHPDTGELWVTDNGRDLLGDDQPADELNVLEPGGNYGWPFCHGAGIPDPELTGGDAGGCAGSLPPAVLIPAHSAPLGLTFYVGGTFPEDYHGDLFVAYHGSWNRTEPTGYKVVRVPFDAGRPAGPPEDFAGGWLLPDTRRWGRPVDVLTGSDGSLLVSDDAGGHIYRIFYAPVAPTATPWR